MAKLELTFRNTTKQTSFSKAFFSTAIASTLKKAKLNAKAINVSVTLVGDDRIKTLNKKHRNKNKATDVLSFPMHEKLIPSTRTPKDGILDIGDIFISIPIAKRYAKRDGMTLKTKLQFLTVHGTLHLLGLDHERSQKEEKEMFALQDRILASL